MSISLNGDGIVSGVTTFTTPLTGVTTFSSVVVGSGSTSIPSISPSGDNNTGVFFPSADTVALSSGGTERLKVDSDGNINIDSGGVYYDAVNNRLAVGTTSPAEKLQVDGSAIFKATNSYLGFQNASGTSTGYIQGQSSFLAIAGDTGSSNTIAFYPASTEAARIDSSGRLLVGTSSARSNVNGTTPNFQIETATTVSTAAASLSVINNQGAGASTAAINLGLTRGTSLGGTTKVESTDELGYINFVGSDGTNFIPAARIFCTVDGTTGANDMPGRLVFSTTADGASSPTERMRIINNGTAFWTKTGVYGGDSAPDYYSFNVDQAQWVLGAFNESTTGGYGIVVSYTADPNNGSNEAYYFGANSNLRFSVRSNGGIANYQSNNVNLCDEREKKNIETLDSTWGCLKNWELKKFHYNEDDDTDDKRYGVIAQQVAPHCPEIITEWVKQKAEDAVFDEDGNVANPAKEEIVRMGVKEQQMMWMAIKALQEAQLRIETLEAEVAVLKSA